LAGAEPALTEQQRRLNLDSFEFVWTTVRDQYWDPKLGGVNWQTAHEEFLPAMQKAETMSQARQVLEHMIGRLGQSHFAIIPGFVYQDLGAKRDGEEGGAGATGIDTRVIGDRILVTHVDDGSPAAGQGVRPGWIILRIEGREMAPAIAKVAQTYQKSTQRELMLHHAVQARISGPVGGSRQIDFLDAADKVVQKTIGLAAPPGELTIFGLLPPTPVWFSARKLANGIQCVAFNLFLDPTRLMTSFGDAVASAGAKAGFIVDLRGNPGGLGIMATGMAGWFIDKPNQQLGVMQTRQGPLKFVVNPRAPAYRGPLAVLVDGTSASTSEIFAGGLQALGRARIFGSRTAGAALPSLIDQLPNGDAFQHANANYISEGGRTLEGFGVIPDVEVIPSREALLAGRDPVLDAAVKWIGEQK
jgi:carboxyl-terminal processing protease